MIQRLGVRSLADALFACKEASGPAQADGSTWPTAIVFDLDGTLIDSAGDIAFALNVALRRRGLPRLDLGVVRELVGSGAPALIHRALRQQGVSRLGMLTFARDFARVYRRDLVRRTTIFDGARELLDTLQAGGYRLGLCTNKRLSMTMETLRRLELVHYFSAIVADRFGQRRKPHPEPLRRVMAELGVTPGETVMVGDSAADVECARAAGVMSVVVRFGYAGAAADALGADAIINSFRDLPRMLKQ